MWLMENREFYTGNSQWKNRVQYKQKKKFFKELHGNKEEKTPNSNFILVRKHLKLATSHIAKSSVIEREQSTDIPICYSRTGGS